MPVKIEKDENNRAVAMIVAECTFGENNIPVPVEGTEKRIEADLIVAAIGQAQILKVLMNLEMTEVSLKLMTTTDIKQKKGIL